MAWKPVSLVEKPQLTKYVNTLYQLELSISSLLYVTVCTVQHCCFFMALGPVTRNSMEQEALSLRINIFEIITTSFPTFW